MYNVTAIKESLFGLVGFKQTRNPVFGLLPPALLQSRSGLYVDDVHPLLARENIHAAINFEEYKYYPQWLPGPHSVGITVTNTGIIYENMVEGNVTEPGAADSVGWQPTSVLGLYLREVMQAALTDVLNRVFLRKKIEFQTKAIFEDLQLFSGTGNRNRKIIKYGRFVGLELNLKQMRDIALYINRIGVQIDTANPDFTLYLYHTSQPEPLQTITLNVDRPGYFQWFPVDLAPLAMVSADYNTGGSFLLGYFESDFVGQAVSVEADLLRGPCMSCNVYDRNAFQAYSKFVDIHPFSVPSGFIDGTTLWPQDVQAYHYNTNFGINLAFTTECDVTDFIVRSERVLSDAVAKAAGVALLKAIAFSTQNKGLTNQIKDLARYELDNKENSTPGLAQQYEMALDALNFDFSGLNSACLPCIKRKKVTHGAI